MNQKLIKGGHTSHFEGKTQKGITLIALVITIIVLLILAGVTINMVLGDDGIIGRAQGASEANANAEKEENREIKQAEKDIYEYLPKDSQAKYTQVSINDKTMSIQEAVASSLANENNNTVFFEEDDETGEIIIKPESIQAAKQSAVENGYLIKLNTTTYVEEEIKPKKGKILVIDLNGNELTYIGEGTSFLYSGLGEIYIIDSSEGKTGKLSVINAKNYNYNYIAEADFNKDGILCSDDYNFFTLNDIYGMESDSEDWDKYKHCDVNEDGKLDVFDTGSCTNKGAIWLPHVEDCIKGEYIYLDIGTNAMEAECGHNK